MHQASRLEAVGSLAAGIAHEINTPIQYIGDNLAFMQANFGAFLAFLEAMRQAAAAGTALSPVALDQAMEPLDLGYLAEEFPKALQQCLEGKDRVARIVQAMKEFSHPASERKQPADLNRAIESTVLVSRGAWKYAADLDLDPALPAVPCLLGDFNQVILNLIVNAAHARRVPGPGAHDGAAEVRKASISPGPGSRNRKGPEIGMAWAVALDVTGQAWH